MNRYLDPNMVNPEVEDPPFAWFANPVTNRVCFTSFDCALVGPFQSEEDAIAALIELAIEESYG